MCHHLVLQQKRCPHFQHLMPCSGHTAYLAVHIRSDVATCMCCRTAGTMGDLIRVSAACSFIPFFLPKELLAKVNPPLPAYFAARWYHRAQHEMLGRQAGWKQGSTRFESRKPTLRQGCCRRAGHVGQLSPLPAHPAGSTLAPRHRNPLPHSSKPRRSNSTSWALLLIPETHDTGLQIDDFLK